MKAIQFGAAFLFAAVCASQVQAVITIDFGTVELGSIALYTEEGVRATAINNPDAPPDPPNHFDIEPGLAPDDMGLALHGGGSGSSNNSEEVEFDRFGAPMQLLELGVAVSHADLWEMVASNGTVYPLPAGLSLLTVNDFGTDFQTATSIRFRSTLPSLVGTEFSLGMDNLTFVPEPTSLILTMISLLGLVSLTRSRNSVGS